MTTTRLTTAIRNYETMNQMVERYLRLCRAYVRLSEQFQTLDLEHMQLKEQMVSLIRSLKQQQQHIDTLRHDNQNLKAQLENQSLQHRMDAQALTNAYEEKLNSLQEASGDLEALKALLSSEAQDELAEAEHHMGLIDETLKEMEIDSAPDLSESDKALLKEYAENLTAFDDQNY